MTEKYQEIDVGYAPGPEPDLGQKAAQQERASDEKLRHMDAGSVPELSRQQRKLKPQSR